MEYASALVSLIRNKLQKGAGYRTNSFNQCLINKQEEAALLKV